MWSIFKRKRKRHAPLATEPPPIPEPGGWAISDGRGPLWLVYDEKGIRKVTYRGQPDYELIIEALHRRRGRR